MLRLHPGLKGNTPDSFASVPAVAHTAPGIDITFRELCNQRLDWIKEHRGIHHYKESRWILAKLCKEFSCYRASAITSNMVSNFLSEWGVDLAMRGKGRQTLNAAIKCGQALYNHPWGLRRGSEKTFAKNPFSSVEFFSVTKKAKYVPSRDIIDRVIQASTGEERVLYSMLRDTGARIGEALSCQWAHINFDRNTIDLFTRKKSGGSLTPRRLILSGEFRASLLDWKRKNPEALYVFENAKTHEHLEYTWAKKKQRWGCRGAGVKYFSLHAWRHYYASNLVAQGVDLAKIQALLGHENIKTTSIYIHALVGD